MDQVVNEDGLVREELQLTAGAQGDLQRAGTRRAHVRHVTEAAFATARQRRKEYGRLWRSRNSDGGTQSTHNLPSDKAEGGGEEDNTVVVSDATRVAGSRRATERRPGGRRNWCPRTTRHIKFETPRGISPAALGCAGRSPTGHQQDARPNMSTVLIKQGRRLGKRRLVEEAGGVGTEIQN